MSAQHPQVVDSSEFIDILDYQFTGDTVTVENKRRAVEGYRIKASIYHAAQFAGIARQTIYRYMDSDPQFARAMEDSFEDAGDVMETSAYEDALGRDGKRGDSLLKMFWLKAHRPKFRDRSTVDIQLVQDDIKELMTKASPLQVPPMTTQFVDGVHVVEPQIEHERVPSPLNQKEDEEHNAS